MMIISGGQTGVDIAALKAAKQCGIKTGGFAPWRFRTLKGPNPALGSEYGLIEAGPSYAERTRLNVSTSDATLRIAKNFFSLGEICTLKAIKASKVPYMDVSWPILSSIDPDDVANKVLHWLRANNVVRLNVAGNSEQTCPGIEEGAYNFLLLLFRKSKEQRTK